MQLRKMESIQVRYSVTWYNMIWHSVCVCACVLVCVRVVCVHSSLVSYYLTHPQCNSYFAFRNFSTEKNYQILLFYLNFPTRLTIFLFSFFFSFLFSFFNLSFSSPFPSISLSLSLLLLFSIFFSYFSSFSIPLTVPKGFNRSGERGEWGSKIDTCHIHGYPRGLTLTQTHRC